MTTYYRLIDGKTEWDSIVKSFKDKDIYFEYDYFDLYRKDGESPLMAYMESDYGRVAYPFILRDIGCHKNLAGKVERSRFFDISSAYGYSGHLAEPSPGSTRRMLLEDFYGQFGDYCKSRSIVSEFIKFSPLLSTHRDMDSVVEVSRYKKMVATNLQDYGDPIYGELKKRKRKNMHKCQRLGMKTVFELAPSSFDIQLEIYYDTMKRNGASEYYFFPREYFDSMLKSLSDHLLLVNVVLDGEIIGFELCLLYGEFIYAHLAGSLSEYRNMSPHDLSASNIISWGHENGYKYFFSGGGLSRSDDDSLYLYKKAFAKNSDFSLYVGRRIWDRDAYDRLVELSGGGPGGSDDFFPEYRK